MRIAPISLLVLAFVGLLPVAAHAGTAQILAPAAAQAAAAPTVKRLAVVAIQNGDTDTERTQLADTAYLRNVFFGPSSSLATWMPANTYGRFSYVPAGDGVYLAPPVAALVGGTGCRSNSTAAQNAKDFLTTAGVSWDAVSVVYDTNGCPWGGLGSMPGNTTWYPPQPSLAAIAHEMGHNQGYPHEPKRDCPGGMISACKENDYSGNSVMSSGGPGRSYSSVQLLHSGWIEPGWRVQTSTPSTYTLKPLHSPASVTGTRVVEYKASATMSYVIETRAAGPQVDKDINNPGVRVYAVSINSSGTRDYHNAWLVNPGAPTKFPYVPTGTVITDKANKLTITVRSSSASGASVTFGVLGAKPSPSTKPSPSSSPTPSSAASPTPTPSAIGPSEQEPDTVTETEPAVDKAATRPTSSTGGTQAMLTAAITGALIVLILVGGVLLAQRARRSRIQHRHRP